MITRTPYTINSIMFTFNWTIDYINCLTKCRMGVNSRDVKLESPIVHAHATSLLATQHWNLSIWLNIILPPQDRLIIFHFLSFFDFVSISVPSTSSFWFITFCLSLSCCESLYASSLFTPFIFPKTNFIMVLLIFWSLRMTRKEWKKRKCKGWNEREGPTFIFGGPTKLFPKITTLFAKHDIDSWILIWVTHCTFSLDFKNALLPKHNINSLMLFPRSFLLDTISMNKQKMSMDAKRHVLLSSTNSSSMTLTTVSVT